MKRLELQSPKIYAKMFLAATQKDMAGDAHILKGKRRQFR